MRRFLVALIVAALTVPLIGQVVTMVVPGGPTLPATCQVRNVFFKTGANPGLYSCNETDLWTGPLSAGGGGSTAWADLTGVPAPVTALLGTNTGDQNLWASFVVSGQTTLTTASPTQALTIVAGSNITLTTDNTAKSLTIAASGGGGGGDVTASGTLTANSLIIGGGTTVVSATTTGTGILTALGINIGSAGAPTLFNGAGGTPSSLTLTNATGLPIGGLTGLGAGIATWLATPSSANLLTAITDETGTGVLVFGTAPTFTTSLDIEAAGARLSAADGVLTLLGLGNGNDETLTIDLDNATANQINLDSTSAATRLIWTPGRLTLGNVANGNGSNLAFIRDHQSRDMFANFSTGGTVQWQVGLIPNSDSYVWTDVSSNVMFRMTTGNVFQIKDTGVSFAATDGVLTLLGLGDGNDESLLLDLDNAAANTIAVTSGTGANVLDLSGFAITVASCTGCGGGGGAYKFSLTVDGGGSTLTTGQKGCATVPAAGTILSATILSTDAAFTTGSITFDVWGSTLDTYPLAVGDSIVASDPPAMTTNTFDFDGDVSTWDTAVVNGGTAATTTVLCAVVDSVTSLTRAQLDLIIEP